MTAETKVRPLVTFALFAYNQERYIREAVEGAFAQTYEPLEIILSDDRSTDRTFEIMNRMVAEYEGPHNVALNRNPQNLGIARHFSNVVKMARAEIVIVAAGDDISFPHRTAVSVNALKRFPEANYAELAQIEIFEFSTRSEVLQLQKNETARLVNEDIEAKQFSLEDYLVNNCPPPTAASRAIRASSFLRFGDLGPSCPTEDTPSLMRMLLAGDGLWLPTVGLARRKHPEALSAPRSLERMNFSLILDQYMSDIETAVAQGLIKQDEAERLQKKLHRLVERRVLRRFIGSGEYGIKEFLFDLLPSVSLTLRDKVYALKQFILRN